MPITYQTSVRTVSHNGESRPVTFIEFEIEGGATTPEEFAASISTNRFFADNNADPRNGVVLSGRGPIWGYALLTHFFHPAAWVGVFDPRLGVVVVQSHTPGIAAGEVWEVS